MSTWFATKYFKSLIPKRGPRGDLDPTLLKNPKNIGFLSNASPDPPKNHKSAKRTIIGTPEKRHLNSVSLTGR